MLPPRDAFVKDEGMVQRKIDTQFLMTQHDSMVAARERAAITLAMRADDP